MKALLRFHVKNKIAGRYVLELSIHEVEASDRYPDGIKCGLICKDLKTGRLVLFDNHHPKGPHIHLDERELEYEYSDDERLIEDFEKLVFRELGLKL